MDTVWGFCRLNRISSISQALSQGRGNYPDQNLMNPVSMPPTVLEHYKVHILVFLLAFFVALTVAHPAFYINDEWITANQLTQLNNGHQLILNEGKYGSFENGTPYKYFETHRNSLGYTLFLPLASLPTEWLVYFMGDHFVFFIVYLWIFLIIALYLLINTCFPDFAKMGKWRWTDGLLILAFILFFINLYYYIPFNLTGVFGRPELEAIVFTNCLLFSLLAVITYDINRTLFNDPLYSFFGVIVCLASSSYLFWSSFCKDHVLVACVFAAVVLMAVRFWKTHDIRYLFAAFIFSGLLAWARPELALFVCVSLCVIVLYLLVRKNTGVGQKHRLFLLLAPVFTVAGAIPLLLNNYLITGNFLHLPWSLWEAPSADIGVVGTVTSGTTTASALQNLLGIIQSRTTIQWITFPQDLSGVLFSPQSGSLAVFPLIPLFLVALFLIPVLLYVQKIRFSREDTQLLGILALLSLAVFAAYIAAINIMNIDLGIAPDIRYLSPLYLPLNLIALFTLQKTGIITGKIFVTLKGMAAVLLVVIPVTLIAMSSISGYGVDSMTLFHMLNGYVSSTIFILIALFLISYLGTFFFRIPRQVPLGLIVLLISVPLIWQIDVLFFVRVYGDYLGGYSFWIPLVRVFFGVIF